MKEENKYTMLICSLPGFEGLFSSKRLPLSRIQLDKRLKMLEPEDANDLEQLGLILDWFRQPLGRSDISLLNSVKAILPTIHSDSIVRYIEWRLEFRSLIAALRQKHRGGAFSADASWGWGAWCPHINKHWQEPGFGLERLMPWLAEMRRMLESEDTVALEKKILLHVWAWLDRESFSHEFDLEAVAIYRMRWDLVARWTSYEKTTAESRFRVLLDGAMS